MDIHTNNNSWPFVCDWNADGRKDLLVGQEGISVPCNVFVYLNQGTNSEPLFNDSSPVLNSGIPINSYRTIPVMEDLDRDGRRDLVLGEWYSSVRFYRNTGTNANPVFAGYLNLVEPDPDSFLNGNPPRVNFTDWDGDGDRDMITCDYYGSVFLRRNITLQSVGELPSRSVARDGFSVVPNPFQERTQIRYEPRANSRVEIRIRDAAGRSVRTIATGPVKAGVHTWSWNGTDDAGQRLPGGTYFITLRCGTECLARRVVLTE